MQSEVHLADYEMTTKQNLRRYTLDLLLEEISRAVRKEKRRAYCNIFIVYPDIFDALPRILDRYNERRKTAFNVDMSLCEEKDMYLVTFVPKERKHEPVFFFWKILRDDKYVTILSFSLERYKNVTRCLDSLIGFIRGFWYAWLGSHFLENFDSFVKGILGKETEILASFQTIIEKGETLPIKARVYPLPPRKFIPLEDIRNWTRESYLKERKIRTFSRMRFKIVSESKDTYFTISLTDRSKIMFEKGDFVLFVTLLKPLVAETRRILDILRRKFYSTEQETKLLGETVKIRSLDLIETLVFRKTKITGEWYENIMELFQSDIPEAKIINFTLLSGNPYFLVHVVDVENGSSIYLSATSEELHIVPAERDVKEATIAKIVGLLQTRVDPSISIH